MKGHGLLLQVVIKKQIISTIPTNPTTVYGI
jgi:hypothetical protein